MAQRNGGDKYSQEYYTPKWLFDRLHARFKFTLDPASCAAADKGIPYFTKEDDGLAQDWTGNAVFCNPPFDLASAFIKKASLSKLLPSVWLVPTRAETQYWHEWVWPYCSDILFLRGRLKFVDKHGVPYKHAPFGACLIGLHGATFEDFTDLGVSLHARANSKGD